VWKKKAFVEKKGKNLLFSQRMPGFSTDLGPYGMFGKCRRVDKPLSLSPDEKSQAMQERENLLNRERRGAGGEPSRKSASASEGLSNYVFGKVQPQAPDLEAAVLGALMLERDVLPVVMDILRPESFYHEAHQAIYRSIIRLFERSHPVDLLTVTEELRKSGDLERVGGSYYLVELTNRVASAANAEYHARIIAQKHIMRELIRLSTRTIKEAYEETTDVFSLLDETEKGLFAITQNNLSRSFENISVVGGRVLRQLEELSRKEGNLTGVPSGFSGIDRITSGWQPSDLIIIAARPGMGKTACVLTMALHAARDYGRPVAFFSLEMSNIQLAQRLFAMEAEISSSKMRNGKLENHEWQRLQEAAERLSNVPIFIDDTPGINIFELRAKCRRMKIQHDIQLVIIDYLQLMSGSSENPRHVNREQEIAGISRALKNMAKELDVPVIALSQLSRAVEVRGGAKRPQLSDLRESGAIEQDADIVAFLYRPDYYGITEDEMGRNIKGMVEFIIAKHRHGALDTVRLRFVDQFARFENLIDDYFIGLSDPIGVGALSGPTYESKINQMSDDTPPF
jgi:replicative DNA helicase